MDKDKLKKYAGWGILGGGLSLITLTYIFERTRWCYQYDCIWLASDYALIAMFLGLFGGLIGWAIAEKWWSALLGGFLMSGIIYILYTFIMY